MADEFEGLGDLFSEPNGPAYEKTENRTGPPLDYVAEKLRRSIERLHGLWGDLTDRGSRGSAQTSAPPSTDRASQLTGEVEAAFYYAMVAYLALHNMLALADPPSFIDRLLAMDRGEIEEWLDGIDREGSVT